MKVEWNRNLVYLLLFTTAAVIALACTAYYLLLTPEHQEVNVLKSKVESAKAQITTLEQRRETEEAASLMQSSNDIQKQLPVSKQLDQLLLTLEKAEGLTGSLIERIEEIPNVIENEETIESVDNEAFSGVSTVTLEMSVLSPSFTELLQFLKEIDHSQRIVNIDSVSFNDERIIEGENGYFFYLVTLTAYYFPGLEALDDERQGVHFEERSDKQSPFPYGDGDTDLDVFSD
ncbi:hypothetical protein EQV77_01155 [Halobacillus fulvus]|nr:hypothetical protein EQV77_01155 [Halobacillus fulvus]